MKMFRKQAAFYFRVTDAKTRLGKAAKGLVLSFVHFLCFIPFSLLYVYFYTPELPDYLQLILVSVLYLAFTLAGHWVAIVRFASLVINPPNDTNA